MNRQEIIAMFEKRAGELIKKWPEKTDPLEVPQVENRAELVGAIKALFEEVPIKSVLDVGCGLGRWARFWTEGVGVAEYLGIEPTAGLAAEAERRTADLPDAIITRGELPAVAAAWRKSRKFDVGFTFTVLEHVPPSDILEVAEILKARCRRLVLIEAVAGDCFCEYVFKHDYRALFGEPSFQKMLDKNKCLMVWK